ncbi:MAG TPA: ChaN family lipoprotein [Gemmatimonadaceae bacterium]|nr:ChaN family lipoprotein [Gemmatimonadaceae bacterium]
MRPLARTASLAAVLFSAVACAPAAVRLAPPPDPGARYRVVAGGTRQETTFEHMAAQLSRAKVIFFGEQHDDPATHAAEIELLQALGRSGRPIVLSLEMFERDVQAVLNDYLAGRVTEQQFLTASRPWPRYATDYRGLVELAKSRGWRVIAANVPRPMASAVGRAGLSVLDTLTVPGRDHAARELSCPNDDYRARFLAEMRSHSAGSGQAPQPGDTLPTAVAERFYLAQCVKDETMAESIVAALRNAPRNAIAVHYNGSFHSDYGHGTAARVAWREPGWKLAIVTAIPASDPALAPVAPNAGRADFLVFTRRD